MTAVPGKERRTWSAAPGNHRKPAHDLDARSFLAVFDLADGRELWRTPRTDVPTWGTPTIVTAAGRTQIAVNGRHLYITSELGSVFVVPATGTFSVVATNKLEETCLSTPAISEGALFLRTREKLVAVGTRR
ncbi:MAG: PQQ-binding-like beta-propeller repeat protein [Verrucomicrobia bacterium]|nr:PQQ-binding-like beta-propeller repeat protein [Verrucomicrobiota bacterium]